MANSIPTKAKQPPGTAAPRRKYFFFIGGAVIAASGFGLLGAALIGSDPGRITADASEARATVLAQSVGTVPGADGRYSSGIRPAYYDSFSFTDGGGQARTGYGEVSEPFYATHGVGTLVDAYYYPEAPDHAVLGTPLGLGPRGIPYGVEIGAILVLVGGVILGINAEPVLAALRLARIGRPRHRG